MITKPVPVLPYAPTHPIQTLYTSAELDQALVAGPPDGVPGVRHWLGQVPHPKRAQRHDDTERNRDIRRWAAENNLPVKARGKLSDLGIGKYEAAHTKAA
jgi:hypothetical protein